MKNLKEQYEAETFNKATFLNANNAELYTSEYVQWLEAKVQKLASPPKPPKNLKTKELNRLNIPSNLRSPLIRWAQRWGIYDTKDSKWYEYSPLERHQKASRTMEEMWIAFQNR